MDDLEATRLCAEAMGLEHRVVDGSYVECRPHPLDPRWWLTYFPLSNDEQAMALVKRFGIGIDPKRGEDFASAAIRDEHGTMLVFCNESLNHCIVYCVAAMQRAKGAG